MSKIGKIIGGAIGGAGKAASKAGGGGSSSGGALGSVSSAVGHFGSQVQRGSVSSGSVPASSYGGAYSQYAPTSSSSASSAAAQAAAEAQAQARRQRRRRQAARVHKEQDRKRKQRSGQDMKVAKSVSKGLKAVSRPTRKVKPIKLTGDVKAPKLAGASASGRVSTSNKVNFKAPKFKAIDQGYKRLSTPQTTNRRATGLPAAERAGKPGVVTPTAKPRKRPQKAAQGSTGGLAKPLTKPPTGKKPLKVAKRLQKAVKKSSGGVPDYVPQQYAGLVSKASRKSNVPAPILSALLRQESGFDPNISSPAGASGIAQFMPGTAASRGVDPMNPKSAIPGAADLLRENKNAYGSWKNALAAYNAGGGAVEQYGGVPPYSETQNYVKTIMSAAKTETGSKAKPIPTKLKRTARQTIGKKPTKAIMKGGKVVKDPKAGEKTKTKFTGRYAGSQDLVRQIVGTKVKGDHGGTKNGEAPGVHSPTGDHYNPEGYAQDINGTSPGENEPPYNQETLDAIVKNLRGLGATDVPDLKIGENWQGEIAGYQVQVLTNEGGTVNHIHVGAHLADGSSGSATVVDPNIPIKGTKLAVKMPAKPTATGTASSGVTALTGATGTAAAPSSSAPTTAKGKKAAAKARKRRAYRNYSPYADSPEGYYSVDPETYAADPFLKRLAELTAAGAQ